MRKSETLRGHGAFRAVSTAGRRLDGKYIRSYAVVTRSADPSFTIGVTVYDRRITAVQRNLIRRRMSEAFTRERRRFAEAVQSSGVRVEAILGYRVRAGAGERSTPFAELHADIAHVLEGIISRIRQQWPQQ